jgi:hypothetical protein
MRHTLRVGDVVEVLSKEEILATLDANGTLRGLSFMPEMLDFCGRRFRVAKRAHKTCDTVHGAGGRWVGDAVHLEDVRCGGEAHGGCQAHCLIFWWAEWVRKVPDADGARACDPASPSALGCTEAALRVASGGPSGSSADVGARYVCQLTQLPTVTRFLPWWNPLQYWEDYSSGNAALGEILGGFTYSAVYRLVRTRAGRLARLQSWYDTFQKVRGGVPFPRKQGAIPADQKTPGGELGLQPGELVRVKSYEEILSTLNVDNKNQGLYFDAEMVPYCGGTYRVLKRVTRILDEKSGTMVTLKKPAIMLENVCCRARYSDRRLFCPRSIHSFWREIWLERVDSQVPRPAPTE